MTSHETTFRRTPGSRIVGLLLYVIILPIVAVILCPLVGFLSALLMHLVHAPRAVSAAVTLVFCLLTLLGLVGFAIYDYRRRAGIVVIVADNCLKVHYWGAPICISFDEVQGVRLVPYRRDAQCVLELADGRHYRLPVEAAPFSIVQAALEATLVRRLAAQFHSQLAGGGSIRVQDHALRAWTSVVQGMLAILAGALIMLTLRGIPFGIVWIRGGLLTVRRGCRGRGEGFEVFSEGLRPVGSVLPSDVRRWSWLQKLHTDAAGMVLRFEDGCAFTASLFAENYWPFAQWMDQLRQSCPATHGQTT